jgi:hypothetical protein
VLLVGHRLLTPGLVAIPQAALFQGFLHDDGLIFSCDDYGSTEIDREGVKHKTCGRHCRALVLKQTQEGLNGLSACVRHETARREL